jgi:hypothetical protein
MGNMIGKGVDFMIKRNAKEKEPTIANGTDDYEELDKKASKEEIENGDFTKVVTLSYDEIEPSHEKNTKKRTSHLKWLVLFVQLLPSGSTVGLVRCCLHRTNGVFLLLW